MIRSLRRSFSPCLLAATLCLIVMGGCARRPMQGVPESVYRGPEATAFLDTLEERTFRFFWDLTDKETGLSPDRWPTQSFSSVAAIGFALTAYPIGVERGYVRREEAAARVRNTLFFLWTAPQDSSVAGATGYRGFYYHFLEPATGHRFKDVELSTVDTALLMAGALFCQSYFDRDSDVESEIRQLAEDLYKRVDWKWMQIRPPTICLAWKPESGFVPYDWRGYNEAMLLHILALGSPTHPVEGDVWDAWLSRYVWGKFHGLQHVGFPPLFGHQYTHVWIDFRGIADRYMREKKIDYFENSRRATYSQREYAIDNPDKWVGYGPWIWGLTACDGPVEGEFTIEDTQRHFHTYWARGASHIEVRDDGTISPSAAGGSIAFAPEIVIPTLQAIRNTYGEPVFSKYGFLDAFNPTFQLAVPVQHGKVVPGVGWFDTDYLGIDQGPILAMIENYRSGLVWNVMRKNPHVVRGLKAAGFSGGWLDGAGD